MLRFVEGLLRTEEEAKRSDAAGGVAAAVAPYNGLQGFAMNNGWGEGRSAPTVRLAAGVDGSFAAQK